jgi:hypothetical protein
MLVKIKDGTEIDLNVGDRVDYTTPSSGKARTKAIVIGLCSLYGESKIVASWYGCDNDNRVADHRNTYSISNEYHDDVVFYTSNVSGIDKVYPANGRPVCGICYALPIRYMNDGMILAQNLRCWDCNES